MSKNIFTESRFHDGTAARQWFEAVRWPNGPICSRCGHSRHYPTNIEGPYRCANPRCRNDFTFQTRAVKEHSHAALTERAVTFATSRASKNGFSAHNLHRQLDCQYKTARILRRRVTESAPEGGLALPSMIDERQVVDANATYFGKIEKAPMPEQRRMDGHPVTKKRMTGTAGERAAVFAS